MSCNFSREHAHAWLDGELSVEATLEAERHARECASCAAEYRRALALRSALREGGLVAVPPASLEARIRSRLAAERRPSWRRGVPQWFAMAAALVLGAALTALLIPFRASLSARGLDEALVSSHVRALMKGPLVEVVSTDRHTVKPWFAGRVDLAPTVKDLADRGYPLSGGRVDDVSGRRAAVLAYTHRRHEIDLFVWVASAPAPAVTFGTSRGYHVARWTEGDLAYAAVSDMDADELRTFVDLVRN
ncbi:MAG TPA: anti-sigma factor [Thermoanaerobaculia bacterium]|nr:anti-sigma factor [Thermoanaerobaculia bacterium]